jgi:hypothetical protein
MTRAEQGQQQFSLFDVETAEQAARQGAVLPIGDFSNFVVYVDESGDHGLVSVDSNYPVFVLAFCVFYKGHYCEKVVPALHKLKFNHFGHDLVVLHEHEIRKEKGDFRFPNRAKKLALLDELTLLIEACNFILIACVIDKAKLRAKLPEPAPNPYHLALGFCLETLYELLQEKQQDDALTHVVFECRGTKEDNELELEFRRICDGANRLGKRLPFDVKFASKQTNSAGLQVADLVARPVGLSVLRPQQVNRAFDVLRKKFFCSGGRQAVGTGYEGWGLKVFPGAESERPR